MLFNSLIFLIFLPCVFIIYWLIDPKWRNLFLLGASYYFYVSYNPWFLALLIGTSALDFYAARLISASARQYRMDSEGKPAQCLMRRNRSSSAAASITPSRNKHAEESPWKAFRPSMYMWVLYVITCL